jgi:hypothetical protein
VKPTSRFCEAAPRCQYRCSSWVFELFVNR